MPRQIALAIFSLAVLCLAARAARAQQPASHGTPIYVLQIESNGPDEQAEALSNTLRSRVKAAAGWALQDEAQTFETLRLVKCPPPHTADEKCLGLIAQYLKGYAFIWGKLEKKGASDVAAEVHLYRPGASQTTASEAYSDNLRESDETLKKIAARMFAKLTGGVLGGTLIVHAGNAAGAVFVDGAQKATLDGGTARIDLPAGPHVVEVRVPSMTAPTQNVTIAAAAEQEATFVLAPARVETPPVVGAKSSVPWRKIIAISAIGLGVVSAGIGTYEGVNFLGLKDDLNNDRAKVPNTVTDVCQDLSTPAVIDACQKYKDAKNARVLEYVFLGVGAALVGGGVVLLVTDKGDTERPAQTGARLVPTFSARGAGLDLHFSW